MNHNISAFCIFLLVIGTAKSTVNAQDLKHEEITFHTSFIGNKDYVIAVWQDIPIDRKKGEEMNSPFFGGRYASHMQNEGDWKNGIPIASQAMEIWVDLVNNSDRAWKLNTIKVRILKKYDLGMMDIKEGQSKDYTSRLNQYSPTFYFSDDSAELLENRVRKSVFVYPKQSFQDNRFAIKFINHKENPAKNIMYCFEISMELIDTGKLDHRVTINSDKHYFLAFVE